VIPAIPAITSIGSSISAAAGQVAASGTVGSTGAASATPSAAGTTPASFSDALGNAIDSLSATQQSATNLSLQAATGNANIGDVTVASTEADLETQLVTAVRDKAVDAFNSIMDMQA
jgi:flagellar hook-basal body complex protein FliE